MSEDEFAPRQRPVLSKGLREIGVELGLCHQGLDQRADSAPEGLGGGLHL
ncbi:MAG: hypothetical protein WDN30_09190 [Pararobbsia sp.]